MSNKRHVTKQKCQFTGREIDFDEPVFIVNGKVASREGRDSVEPKCPYCKKDLKPPVEDGEQCPHCEGFLVVNTEQKLFPTTIITEAQYEAFEDFEDLLTPRGVKQSRYGVVAQQMQTKTGEEPEPADVIKSLWQDINLKVHKDVRITEEQELKRPDTPGAQPGLHEAIEVTAAELEEELLEDPNYDPDEYEPTQGEIDHLNETTGTHKAITEEDESDQTIYESPANAPTQTEIIKDKKLMYELAKRGAAILRNYGVDKAAYDYIKQSFLEKMSRPPTIPELLQCLTKLTLTNMPDKQMGLIMLTQMARLFYSTGLNPRAIQKERAKTQLKLFNKLGVKQVQVETGDEACPTCIPHDGKVISIDKALNALPIPFKECRYYADRNNKYPFCTCDFSPKEEIAFEDFDELLDNADFTNFLANLGDD